MVGETLLDGWNYKDGGWDCVSIVMVGEIVFVWRTVPGADSPMFVVTSWSVYDDNDNDQAKQDCHQSQYVP